MEGLPALRSFCLSRLTATLEEIGAFDDEVIAPDETDRVFAEALRAQGGEVTLAMMPGSSHASLTTVRSAAGGVALRTSVTSAVVLQKSSQHGAEPELVGRLLTSFGLRVADVTPDDAERAAGLWQRGTPLSLADRLCLALGSRLGLPVAAPAAAWAGVAVPQLRVIRRP